VTRRRSWILWVVTPLCALLVWRTFVAPLPMYDLHTFTRAAHQVLAGHDPYPHVPSAALFSGHAFVYPWLTAHLFIPFALLTPGASDVAWFALSCLAIVAACRAARLPDRWSVLVVLLSATTIRGLQVGSLNSFLFLGAALAWTWRDRPWRVAAMLTLVVGAKVFLAPLLIWLLIARRWRALGLSVGGVGTFLGLGFLLGPIGPRTYEHLLSQLSEHESGSGFSLGRLLTLAHAGSWASTAALGISVGLLALAGVLAHRGHLDEVSVFSVAVVAALMSTPILWSHYLLLATLPLLAVRASIGWFVVASGISWLTADPARMHPLLGWDMEDRLTSLYACLAGMVVLIAIRGWPGGADHRGRARNASASR
jgi:alpha-1,2-mannosyltransferase